VTLGYESDAHEQMMMRNGIIILPPRDFKQPSPKK
jgi:hypothetical protein